MSDDNDSIQIRIDHDDGALDVITKVNEALESYGLSFDDDGLEHDGFVLLNLMESDLDDAIGTDDQDEDDGDD